MKSVRNSLRVQGVYALLVGLTLLVDPEFMLRVLQVPGDSLWPRMVGLMAIGLGIYYLTFARGGESERTFAVASLFGRAVAVIGIVALSFGLGYPMLLAIAAVEGSLTLWTGWALRTSPSA